MNLNLVVKDDHGWEKSKHRFVVGYGAITDHLAILFLIRRKIWDKKNSWRTCFCLLPKAIYLFMLLRISVEVHGLPSKSPNCVPKLEASGLACHS